MIMTPELQTELDGETAMLKRRDSLRERKDPDINEVLDALEREEKEHLRWYNAFQKNMNEIHSLCKIGHFSKESVVEAVTRIIAERDEAIRVLAASVVDRSKAFH